jgi:hypothetical protein
LIQHFNKTENAVSVSVNVPRKKPVKKIPCFGRELAKPAFSIFNILKPAMRP